MEAINEMFATAEGGIPWGVLFTLVVAAACVTDVRSRRIPNALVAFLALAGLLFSVATRGPVAGLLASLGGIGLGLAIWIAFWLAGVLGAGDVKFFAAMGAWLGPAAILRAALAAALAGGVLAVVALAARGRLGDAGRRLTIAAATRSLGILEQLPQATTDHHRHLPYGVAMAVGALAVAWFPQLIPW